MPYNHAPIDAPTDRQFGRQVPFEIYLAPR